MKPRKQSLLFFLTFLGLVIASAVAIFLKPTVLGLDLAGGSQITLEGQETRGVKVTSESIDRSVEIIRGRVDKQGVSEPTIATQNGNQIVVQLPGVLNRLVAPAQMAFYNYEASLANNVGQNPGPNAYELVKRASKLPPDTAAKTPQQYFLFGTGSQHLLKKGFPVTNKELLKDASGSPLKGEVVVLPAGYAYVHAPDGFDRAGESFAIFKDEPAISGNDLQSSRVVAGQHSDYDVQPNFSDKGIKAFATLTKDLARRGKLRGVQQHFAIVLDGELVSNPVIDYEQNPNGLPDGGVINGAVGQDQLRRASHQADPRRGQHRRSNARQAGPAQSADR
jgi:SecD/SecF fusion protein